MASKSGLFDDLSLVLDSTKAITDQERDLQITKLPGILLDSECQRIIHLFKTKDSEKKWKKDPAGNPPVGEIEEHTVFWPSAPVYELGWPRVHLLHEGHSSTWHTMRLLKRPGQKTIDRIYIFFNGLNEWRTFQTYYRLADLLFMNEERRRRRKDPEFGPQALALFALSLAI